MSELEVAIRDLEDEYSDGLITEQAYIVRKEEMKILMESK
jgi:hypothetical protein